eukprot:TRINITY_DN707_c0_g1_i1.p1 TRINITY_DN707_c0_g1~~TRINITY_DN707_c0_g1_i1.p1  ORF type:complete len:188 (+),score=29.18 TRINITY_DN707_c0_g1_i1:49-612(+)
MGDIYLFKEDLIKEENINGTNFIIKPLERQDFENNFSYVLSQLTTVGSLNNCSFKEQFDLMKEDGSYFIIVIKDKNSNNDIIGLGSILIERKFIHSTGLVGHIEDIVVDERYRGNRLGKIIIDQLVEIGHALGCYKIILDCSEKNVTFYNKCGFKKKEIQMVLYIDDNEENGISKFNQYQPKIRSRL